MWIVSADMETPMDPTRTPDRRPTPAAEEPVPPPRTFLDSAEPLTAWRVDLAVLVGVVQQPVRA
jgi:hypothetical protein